MRESHKHLFLFLLAVTAFLWGVTRRSFPPGPEAPEAANAPKEAPDDAAGAEDKPDAGVQPGRDAGRP